MSWRAPRERTDGQPLAIGEIRGYRIHYGERSGRYDYSVEIEGAQTTSTKLKDLPLGSTYFMVLTAVDIHGLESGYSNEAVKVVQ